ncbi:TPA: restriction endonuclease subunit S [Campylobacter upsaliensis]|nr:restriction endonuclease subunit S [Campylobacter upsaliensis]HEP3233589.1 restriction endonuclease subunit S [Campylobacter upsaliensis]HEP3235180.1 restriction endonuclease subunit S [Campylobacter upsaliensis]
MKKHTQSPYESSKVSYKPSGIEWLGEIPQSWEIRRLKHLTILFTGESIKDADKDKYSIVENAIPYIATKDIGLDSNDVNYNNGMFIQNDDTGFKRAYKNSTLLCLEGANAGKKIAFLNQEVCFVNKLCCISNKSKELDSKALFYFFQGSFFKNTFFSNISGLIGGVTTTQLGNFKIPLPPLQEQKEIAAFLDSKCEKIQNYIDKKQKLITLLQEKKQALINEAVTKGLNPNIESKNSGIEYLGLIPHHWEVRRMKFMASIHNGREQTEIADENGIYPIYGSGGILGKSMYFIYDKPSVLLGRKGTIDKPLFVEEPFWTIDTMFYTSVSKIVLPKYFYYLCLTIDFQFYISGSAIPSMTQYDLANISFALPPLQEQKQIANFLDEKCEKINSAIEKTKKQIELVKEYKNTLINEAVCGRIACSRDFSPTAQNDKKKN